MLVLNSCEFPESQQVEPKARVVECRDLFYSDGGDPGEDRPPHVRAGSSLIRAGGRLVVVQDDASILAVVDPDGENVESVLLPAGPDGARVFDTFNENKHLKPDLESAFSHEGRLLILGSGSSPQREKVMLIEGLDRSATEWGVHQVDAPALYQVLRNDPNCAGSELNIEGAMVQEHHLLLFQRGNGAPAGGLEPVDAVCRLELAPVLEYLQDPQKAAVPGLLSTKRIDIGDADGVPLTITDVTAHDDQIYFLAVAEDSPDALRDGPVTAVVLGLLDHDTGQTRWATLVDAAGAPYLGKSEGIAIDPAETGRAWIVTDRDHPKIPAELCRIEFSGFE